MDAGPDRAKEREARIEELERRLATRRPVGVRAWAAALCIFGTLVLAWLDREDLRYYFSEREPITLGTEGAYDLSAIAPNRYVQLHGVPTTRGLYADERGETEVIVGLRESPFLVKRHALPGEERVAGKPPPPPSQTPFGIRGRLLTRVQAQRYDRAFEDFAKWGEVQTKGGELFLIAEGEKPGEDRGLAALMALLGAFAALNVYFLIRDLRFRMQRRA